MAKFAVPLIVFCLTFADLFEASAAQKEIDMDAEAKVVSAFVWRGRSLNSNPCFQPSFTAGMGDFSANIWGSLNLTSVDDSWRSSRVDATFDYKFAYGPNIIRPGLTAYIGHDNPEGESQDTAECFVSYTYDCFLLPSVVLYYDVSKIKGFYTSMSVAHSYSLLKDKVALDFKLQLDGAGRNFNNALFNYPAVEAGNPDRVPDKTSLVDAALTASLPIAVGKTGVLTPAVRVIMLLDSATKDLVSSANEDITAFVYSLAFNMWF